MREDRGVGLIEVVVVMGLLGLALAMFGSALAAMRRTSDASLAIGEVTDQARLAVNVLDRQIRFGYWVKQNTISGASSAITVLTQDTSGALQCWTWAIDGENQRLMTFVFPAASPRGIPAVPAAGAPGTDWQVAAELIDAASSLQPTIPMTPLDPATYTRPAGLYAGAVAMIYIANGDRPSVGFSVDMTARNRWRGGGYATKCSV